MKNLLIAIVALILSTYSTSALTYRVKRGDTLSQIIRDNIEGRIYGDKGYLKKILRLNPKLKDPNYIDTEQVIILKVEREKPAEVVETETAPEDEIKQDEIKQDQVEEEIEFQPYSEVKLIPHLLNTTVTNVSSTTTQEIKASGAYGMMASIPLHWRDNFSTQIGLSASRTKFEIGAGKTLTNPRQLISDFFYGGSFRLNRSFRIDINGGYKTLPFFTEISTNQYEIRLIQSPFLHNEIKYLYSYKLWSATVSVPFSYQFGASENNLQTDGGFGYGAHIEIHRAFKYGVWLLGARHEILKNSFNNFDTEYKRTHIFTGIAFKINHSR